MVPTTPIISSAVSSINPTAYATGAQNQAIATKIGSRTTKFLHI